MDLEPIRVAIRNNLDAKYEARENGLTLCRQAIRLAANSIRAIHRHDSAVAERLMEECRLLLDEASMAMVEHPEIHHAGFFHDASKEYAEARLTHALVFDRHLPSPQELAVEPAAYLNGMGEAVGELRRHVLDLMRRGNLGRSEHLMVVMDEIYYLLITMDYPDAMTGGLRRTTDVARSIIERTRGDLTTTLIQYELKSALEQSRPDPG